MNKISSGLVFDAHHRSNFFVTHILEVPQVDGFLLAFGQLINVAIDELNAGCFALGLYPALFNRKLSQEGKLFVLLSKYKVPLPLKGRKIL